jgi:hypothetical protein
MCGKERSDWQSAFRILEKKRSDNHFPMRLEQIWQIPTPTGAILMILLSMILRKTFPCLVADE